MAKSFALKKPLILNVGEKLWIIANVKQGIYKIFMCSQVDSFTADMGANINKLVQSYKKCSIVPKSDDNENPAKCQSEIFGFIILPLKLYKKSLCVKLYFYASAF